MRIGFQKTDSNPNGIDFDNNKLFFKFQIDEDGSMETIECDTIEEFYELQKKNPKNFFQVVRENVPVREYYDIDIIDGVVDNDDDFLNAFLVARSKVVTKFKLPPICQIYEKNSFMILTAHSDKKKSFHIYSKFTAFMNIAQHKIFAEELKQQIPQIDLSVYNKNRAMRLIGNSKVGQNRPLVARDQNYTVADTLIELNPLNKTGRFNNLYHINPTNLPLRHDEGEELDTNLSKKKFMKDFLKENTWFKLDVTNKKLRRTNDDVRRPCLVYPKADHGTENMSINCYRGIYYVQCYQHKGKFKIPGQKNETKTETIETIWSLEANPFPTLNEHKYFWLDLVQDIKNLNKQNLYEDDFAKLIYSKFNLVLCYIVDLQCYVIRSSKSNPNQLSKTLPEACMYICSDYDLPFPHSKPFNKLLSFLKEKKLIYNYESITFDPNPNYYNPKVLNTWNGFQIFHDHLDNKNLQKIIYHFRDVWCAGNQEHYDWLINCWFKPFFQNPHILTGTALVLWSEQGAGKNIIIDEFLIPFIFGENQSSSVTGISKITQKHNTIIQDKIFCNVNELPRLDINGKNRDCFDAIKGLLTDKYITIEPKGIASFKIPNYTRYIFCSNHKESLFIESGDRRFMCLELSSKHKGDFEYFKTLKNAMNQSTANAFFQYCLDYEPQTPNLDVRKIPITNLKLDMIKNCASSTEQFCMEIKEYIKLYDETKWDNEIIPQQHKYEQLEFPNWVREIFDKEKYVSATNLFIIYQHFCEYNNYKPVSQKKLCMKLAENFRKDVTRIGKMYFL